MFSHTKKTSNKFTKTFQYFKVIECYRGYICHGKQCAVSSQKLLFTTLAQNSRVREWESEREWWLKIGRIPTKSWYLTGISVMCALKSWNSGPASVAEHKEITSN